MLLFDFCNRLARHVHFTESSDARGDRIRLRGGGAPVGDESPAGNPSHEVFDDTPRALVVELHASSRLAWRATSGGHGPILRVPDRGTLGPRPQACGVVFRAPGELHFR